MKATFRAGQAYLGLNDLENAQKFLSQAEKLDPNDKAIQAELKKVVLFVIAFFCIFFVHFFCLFCYKGNSNIFGCLCAGETKGRSDQKERETNVQQNVCLKG